MLKIIRIKNGRPDDPAGEGTVWKRSTNLFAKTRVPDRFSLNHVESGIPRMWYPGSDPLCDRTATIARCGWSLGGAGSDRAKCRPGGAGRRVKSVRRVWRVPDDNVHLLFLRIAEWNGETKKIKKYPLPEIT